MSSRKPGQDGRSGSPRGVQSVSKPARPPRGPSLGPAAVEPVDRRTRIGLLIVVLVLGALAVLAADFVFGAIGGQSASSPSASSASSGQAGQAGLVGVVQGKNGHWTNVSPNQLADMLTHKDFTLVNVKTPYMGEIDGTDLYLPYDQLASKAASLPADKTAKILVYCRTGTTSAIAAQTLLDLGYTNVWNLDGGMNAWTSSGRTLVQKNR